MIKKIFVVLSIILLACRSSYADNSDKLKRTDVWKVFNKVRYVAFGKFQKIDVYGEKPDLTEICYISKGIVYIFYYKDKNNKGLSHIEKMEHAKIINPGINRISYEKSKDNGFGFFKLWYYGKIELSIGSS